jgi:hypothetical protein
MVAGLEGVALGDAGDGRFRVVTAQDDHGAAAAAAGDAGAVEAGCRASFADQRDQTVRAR